MPCQRREFLPQGKSAHAGTFRSLRVDFSIKGRFRAASHPHVTCCEQGILPTRPSAPFLVRKVPPAPPRGPAAISLRPRRSGLRAALVRRRRARCPMLPVARLRRPWEMAPSPLSFGPPGCSIPLSFTHACMRCVCLLFGIRAIRVRGSKSRCVPSILGPASLLSLLRQLAPRGTC